MSTKKPLIKISGFLVRPTGIEPTHPAPEAGALSTELRAHNHNNYYNEKNFKFKQKKSKKGVDISKTVCYNNKAVTSSDTKDLEK